jgi:protein-S-isoprenylcysteine O-methyltransferase Ste14
MEHLFARHPVWPPQVIAMLAGALCFFALVIKVRLAAARREEATSGLARASLFGIFLQMLGFASAGFGKVAIRVASPPPSAWAAGALVAALMAGAVLLFLGATRAMGRNWSLVARTRTDHELVTSGVFARLRHPIYLAMSLFLLSLAVGLGHERNLAVALPLFALGTWIRLREEEKLLRAQFGPAYERYAGSVKRFVPGLF